MKINTTTRNKLHNLPRDIKVITLAGARQGIYLGLKDIVSEGDIVVSGTLLLNVDGVLNKIKLDKIVTIIF